MAILICVYYHVQKVQRQEMIRLANINSETLSVVSSELSENTLKIQNFIYIFRDKQVMIDSDLAALYHVETGALNRAVKRNINRFPEDFCFRLTTEECQLPT